MPAVRVNARTVPVSPESALSGNATTPEPERTLAVEVTITVGCSPITP